MPQHPEPAQAPQDRRAQREAQQVQREQQNGLTLTLQDSGQAPVGLKEGWIGRTQLSTENSFTVFIKQMGQQGRRLKNASCRVR